MRKLATILFVAIFPSSLIAGDIETPEDLAQYVKDIFLEDYESVIGLFFHWPDSRIPFPVDAIPIFLEVNGKITFTDKEKPNFDVICYWRFIPIGENYWEGKEIVISDLSVRYNNKHDGVMRIRSYKHDKSYEIQSISFGHINCGQHYKMMEIFMPKLEAAYPNGYF